MRVSPNKSKKFPPVVETKLSRDPYKGKDTVWGRCDSANTGAIVIDPRLSSLHYMDTLIHELLHREFCFLREEVVGEVATVIAKELWEKNFRRLKP
jgi:hypothetical protein